MNTTSRGYPKWMIEFAKLVHSVFGVESPRAFVLLFAIIGGVLFGGVGWLVAKAYQKEQSPPTLAAEQPPEAIRIVGGSNNTVRNNELHGGTIGVYDSPGTQVFHNIIDLQPWFDYLLENAGRQTKIEKFLKREHARLESTWAGLPEAERQRRLKALDGFERRIRRAANNEEATKLLVEKLKQQQQ